MWNNLTLKGNQLVYQPDNDSNRFYHFIYNILKSYNNKNFTLLDMGCGSGAIGLALKKNLTNNNIELIGSDINQEAIKYSILNAKNNNLSANFIYSDLFNNINNSFDIIICSVPFLSYNKIYETLKNINNPLTGIIVGNDSNESILIEKVSNQANKYLNNNGLLFMETGKEEQCQDIINILNNNNFIDYEITENAHGQKVFIKAQYQKNIDN